MISSISAAVTWDDYYEAHRAMYIDILQKRWALGALLFANHIHHPAVPDTSGVVIRVVNWAAYSQVTRDGLAAFAEVFERVIEREPIRKKTRYFVFTRSAAASEGSRIPEFVNSGIDVWNDDFESALAIPESLGPLDSINALFGSGDRAIVRRENLSQFLEIRVESFRQLRASSREAIENAPRSVIPRVVRSLLIDSSIVLTAFRCGVDPADVVLWLDVQAGMAARIASERAAESGWGHSAQAFCEAITVRAPPAAEVYVVKQSDILSRIVREKYGLSFYQVWPLIRALNPGLDPDKIFPKQEIALPVIS